MNRMPSTQLNTQIEIDNSPTKKYLHSQIKKENQNLIYY